ncbi:DUF3187 family protein [Seongchinamella sediminis]|uniref:DUF3187 family protein n=1 Tax=Seongchinamella sediminis TaxID=2283635 RepID=A0A3L7DTR7_9GAMM|nr:DUF3187 family protein [Seongchinamella sediminis]RLQ20987.1 DUF3187 family protein [Seongchinamella sediminis]
MAMKWWSAVVLAGSQGALAAEPLYVKNLSPVAGLLGLPSQRSADIAPAGQFDLALHGSIASHYVAEAAAGEYLHLDGETARLALEARYAVADNWDLQLELPWLEHSGGSLDSVIDNWHDFWGMSDGGRSDVERDLLDYRYAGPDSFALADDGSGPGDASLALSYRFFAERNSSAALVAGYKFATGDEDEFLGSGAEDAYLALRFSGYHGASLPLRWHGQLGYLYAGESERIATVQEQHLWFAGLAVDWRIGQAWSLLGQVDAHAAPADSAIKGIGEAAIMLSVGARWRFAERWALELSLVEDIQVETAPDVTFQASLRWRPGAG